jgi:hypothetical protein
MYFWDSRRLAVDLRNDAVSPAQLKNYLIGLAIIGMPTAFFSEIPPEGKRLWWGLYFAVAIAATVIGLNRAYKANGGDQGLRFTEKVVALLLPLTLQTFVLMIVAELGVHSLQGLMRSSMFGGTGAIDFADRVLDVVALGWVPWIMYRLVAHIPDTIYYGPDAAATTEGAAPAAPPADGAPPTAA